MTVNRDTSYIISIINELRKLPKETEWVEFKLSDDNPVEIGEYISALSNSAALLGKASAYLVWGIDDSTHEVLGTTFSPSTARKGQEELENWLLRSLEPELHIRFFEVQVDGKQVVLLKIPRAYRHPVAFKKEEFVRVGSYKKKLKDFAEKEKELWRILGETPFEEHVAAENVTVDEVLKLLDYPAYFDITGSPLPATRDGILKALEAETMIALADSNNWNVLNLGAILFAKKLSDFKQLRRKAVRVVLYRGNSRVETVREQEGGKGYASGFEGLIGFINNLLPTNEVVGPALRKDVPMYPELAVRELVANAIVHQDFFITGAGPLIEIFSDRMEITNPGKPLVETSRFLDSPPRSRNDALASFMRRIGVCEERGSGVDKVVFQTEYYQLPAPSFEVIGDNTRATLFAHKPFHEMDKDDRTRACYLHACLRYVSRDYMTNATLRKRFGIETKNSATASRIIKEALTAGAIKHYDENAAPKFRKYIPFWA